jgi:hypothetical protein
MIDSACGKDHHRFHNRPVPVQPGQICAVLRIARVRGKAGVGEQAGQILNDGRRFGNQRSVMQQGRRLAFGVGVCRIAPAAAIAARDGDDLCIDPVGDAHFVNQRHDAG